MYVYPVVTTGGVGQSARLRAIKASVRFQYTLFTFLRTLRWFAHCTTCRTILLAGLYGHTVRVFAALTECFLMCNVLTFAFVRLTVTVLIWTFSIHLTAGASTFCTFRILATFLLQLILF